jgi:NTP pyrophosphatase (non-canonical NTP hydrolase)
MENKDKVQLIITKENLLFLRETVLKTAKIYPDSKDPDDDLPFIKNMNHALSGMYTELAEIIDALKAFMMYDRPIDELNIKEEFGDFLWFLVLLMIVDEQEQVFEKDLEFGPKNKANINEPMELQEVLTFVLLCPFGYFTSRIRKGAIQQKSCKQLSNELSPIGDMLNMFNNQLVALWSLFDFDISEVIKMNRKKLEARYPEGFKEDNANNRDKEKEYTSMKA